MTIALTRDQALALKPCSATKVPKFTGTMNAAQALEAGVSIDDLLWVAGKLGCKELCVDFALRCTQRVAHLNPDPRVRAALDATAAGLADPSEENKVSARADGAAGAAWVAEAAARAAWVAEAAEAAEAAAWAAEREAQKVIFLEVFG